MLMMMAHGGARRHTQELLLLLPSNANRVYCTHALQSAD